MIDFTEKLIAENPVTIRRRVLWGDCDPAGVVYTPRFSDYFAAARDWFLRVGLGVLDRPHPARPGLTFPMRALSFDFRSFLTADDLFDMRILVTTVSRRSFTVDLAATHDSGRAVFTATGTQVCFDQRQGVAVALPDSVVTALERYRQGQATLVTETNEK
jgi:acyl-CoA thioester hydrolase